MMTHFEAATLLSQRADRLRSFAASASPSLAHEMLEEAKALGIAVAALLRERSERMREET